jgi:4a-hydroxytetrahydrobiopterin dehydratase
MNSELANLECKSCPSGAPPLQGAALQPMQEQLDENWKLVQEQRLERQFKFPNFIDALQFTNRVGEIAEQQEHHPDIYLTYGEVRLQIWTHSIDGLSKSDFILAAKIDQID